MRAHSSAGSNYASSQIVADGGLCRGQVPGGNGAELQDEVASLIMPMLLNMTNGTNGTCTE